MKLTRKEVQEALHPAPEGCYWEVSPHRLQLRKAGVTLTERRIPFDAIVCGDIGIGTPQEVLLQRLRKESLVMVSDHNARVNFPSGEYR